MVPYCIDVSMGSDTQTDYCALLTVLTKPDSTGIFRLTDRIPHVHYYPSILNFCIRCMIFASTKLTHV